MRSTTRHSTQVRPVARVWLHLAPRLTRPARVRVVAAMEELTIGNIKFRTFDLGGHTVARKVWSEYFQQVDAVVYMVDTVDRERFAESKAELDGLLGTEGLTDVPFLILANKIDVPQAASEEEVRGNLGLHNMTTGKGTVAVTAGVRPIEIFCCSVVKRMGYKEGFQWLSQYIA